MRWFDRLRARTLLRQAESASTFGDLEGAVRLCQRSLDLADGELRLEVMNRLGTLSYDRGDFATAVRWYREALAATPDAPHLLMNLANALDRLGDRPGARAAYESAVAAHGETPTLLFNLAVFESGADPRRAAGLLQRCVEALVAGPGLAEVMAGRAPEPGMVAERLGDLAVEHGLVDDTDRFLTRLAATLPPPSEKSLMALEVDGLKPGGQVTAALMNAHAMMLSMAGRHDDALALYARLRAALGDPPALAFNTARALLRAERLDEAAALFASLPIPEGDWGTALVHERRGELAVAARSYARFLDRAGTVPDDALRAQARAFLAAHPVAPLVP